MWFIYEWLHDLIFPEDAILMETVLRIYFLVIYLLAGMRFAIYLLLEWYQAYREQQPQNELVELVKAMYATNDPGILMLTGSQFATVMGSAQ